MGIAKHLALFVHAGHLAFNGQILASETGSCDLTDELAVCGLVCKRAGTAVRLVTVAVLLKAGLRGDWPARRAELAQCDPSSAGRSNLKALASGPSLSGRGLALELREVKTHAVQTACPGHITAGTSNGPIVIRSACRWDVMSFTRATVGGCGQQAQHLMDIVPQREMSRIRGACRSAIIILVRYDQIRHHCAFSCV